MHLRIVEAGLKPALRKPANLVSQRVYTHFKNALMAVATFPDERYGGDYISRTRGSVESRMGHVRSQPATEIAGTPSPLACKIRTVSNCVYKCGRAVLPLDLNEGKSVDSQEFCLFSTPHSVSWLPVISNTVPAVLKANE